MNKNLHHPSSPFQGLREGKPMLVARAGTGSIQDTGVWLFLAIVISALPEGWIRMHELPWQQAALSLTGLVIFFLFVCLFVEPFFFLLISQRRFWFGFFDHLPSWIFLGSSCKPAISLSLHVSSQWDRMKGRIWNKILFECQPAVEEAGILPRENICLEFCQGVEADPKLWCVSLSWFCGCRDTCVAGSARQHRGCFPRCSDLTTVLRGQHFCPLHSRRFVRVSEKLLA